MTDPLSRAAMRRVIVERAHGCCEYCFSQMRYSSHSYALEHILPKSRGGTTVLGNLALSCQGCNDYKHTKIKARDPLTGRLAALFHPRRHRWREHFTWNAEYLEIVGLTPTGRATVAALQINREEVVNLRRILLAFDEHPPQHFSF